MTNEQINIAIAETCGWRHEVLEPVDADKIWLLPSDLPDYCNDLNAMHEAMKTLSEEQVEKVWETLCDMIPNNPHAFRNGLVFDVPSKVRAEAFLRVIGKWQSY